MTHNITTLTKHSVIEHVCLVLKLHDNLNTCFKLLNQGIIYFFSKKLVDVTNYDFKLTKNLKHCLTKYVNIF